MSEACASSCSTIKNGIGFAGNVTRSPSQCAQLPGLTMPTTAATEKRHLLLLTQRAARAPCSFLRSDGISRISTDSVHTNPLTRIFSLDAMLLQRRAKCSKAGDELRMRGVDVATGHAHDSAFVEYWAA